MSEFQPYDAATHPEVKLVDDYNNIVDHAFEKTADYIIRKKDDDFQIIYGSSSNQAGKIYDSDSDFETLFQDLLDNIGYAQVIEFKGNLLTGFPFPTGYVDISTGFTIPSTADGLEIRFAEIPLFYVPLARGWIFRAAANVPLFTVNGKTKFHGLRAVNNAATHFSYGVLANQAVKIEKSLIRTCDIGVDLKAQYSEVIDSSFSGNTTAILKENNHQHLFFNRMFANDYGIDFRKAGFDIVEGNFIQGGTYGLKVDTLDSTMCYVCVTGGKIHDCNVGAYINDADAKFSIVGTKMEHLDNYHVQVVNSTYAMLMSLPLEVSDEVAIRTEGGKIMLMGICCEVIGIGSSYSTIGAPTVIQRGCYSSDGLLEAL